MQEFELSISDEGIKVANQLIEHVQTFIIPSKKYSMKFLKQGEEFVKKEGDVIIYGEYGLVGNILRKYFTYENVSVEGNENLSDTFFLRICIISILEE